MIREYKISDESNVVEVWLQSGLDEYSYLPTFQLLDFDRAMGVFREHIAPHCKLWIEESNSAIRGFLAVNETFVDRLFVSPSSQRIGVGEALINHAKTLMPQGLDLYTHQQNRRARSFYEKHGFVAVKFGISPPPESAPDVEYHWRPENAKSSELN